VIAVGMMSRAVINPGLRKRDEHAKETDCFRSHVWLLFLSEFSSFFVQNFSIRFTPIYYNEIPTEADLGVECSVGEKKKDRL